MLNPSLACAWGQCSVGYIAIGALPTCNIQFIVPFKARRCPGPRRDLMYARINRATDFIDAAVERGAAVYVHADVDAAPASVDAEVGLCLCLCLCLAGRVLVQGVGDRPLVDWPISLASSIVVVNYITGSIDL